MSISELADAAGLTRRAVRFYVQQKLLAAPRGLGRGKHYDGSHLERLRRIRQLQLAGHSLEEIRQILEGPVVVDPEDEAPRPAAPVKVLPVVRAELWRRLRFMEGVELSFDAARFNPEVEDLLEIREKIVDVFGRGSGSEPDTRSDNR